MRLIDADALKRKMQKVATEAWKMKLNASIEKTFNQCMDYIDSAPTIEPKQGEWKLSAFQNDADVANGNYAFICSNCEHTDIHALTQTVPYCWWCGARMKGADDE